MRILLLTAAAFTVLNTAAQDHFCGATQVQNEWFAQHPELKKKFDILQQQAADQDKAFTVNHSQQRPASAASFTIPMVFHILHLGGSENISDAQVIDAVSILNRDYRKLNPDTANVINPFKNNIGDAKIEFKLATRDPSGNCTNGIVRHWDTKTNWNSNNFPDYVYTWDPTKYLNVYVVKTMSGNAAGYTYLPGSGIPSNGDAVVILSSYVGSIGSGSGFTSRALTHEVGHWFNLAHPWGNTNNPGVACGDDGVTDTPITKGSSSCNLSAAICNPPIIENVQNYMDYSYCSKMFTNGQTNRMQIAAANTTNGRNNLWTPTNLLNTGLTNPLTTCAPQLEMSAPAFTVCAGQSLSLVSYTSNADPTNFLWTATNGASVTSSSANGATVLFTNPGSAVVSCVVSNANGSDNKSVTINVINSAPQIITSYAESFESGLIVPSQWTVLNPTTPNVSWQISSNSANLGLRSVYVNAEDSPPNFEEILESPSYDFKHNPGAQFTFYYAYARFSASNKDVFKVQASKDCGGTWTDIWAPTTGGLASSSGGTTDTLLIPTTQWVLYTLTDSPYFNPFTDQENVRIRFYFKEDPNGVGYGNRIYLDDVNFSLATGINEYTKAIDFKVYPNPSESAFNVNFTLSSPAKIKYQVVSVTGSVVMEQPEKSYAEGSHELTINSASQLSKGMYILNFEMNNVKMSKKLLVN